MGLNRKGIAVERSAGVLLRASVLSAGRVYAKIELFYEIRGMSRYSVVLTVFADRADAEVTVRFHKQSVWDPENVYVSLPFTSNEANEELYLHKAGASVRPGIDQLPGTGNDYYCIQEGYMLSGERSGVAIGTPDAPIVQIGPLEHGTRTLHDPGTDTTKRPALYSWVLNNFWETNFQATLGGFYEFRYNIRRVEGKLPVSQHSLIFERLNAGLLAYRID